MATAEIKSLKTDARMTHDFSPARTATQHMGTLVMDTVSEPLLFWPQPGAKLRCQKLRTHSRGLATTGWLNPAQVMIRKYTYDELNVFSPINT